MPLIVFGPYDSLGSFHPVLLALTTNETETEYFRVFQLADDMVCSTVCMYVCGGLSGHVLLSAQVFL
jgi:hypothetical protein